MTKVNLAEIGLTTSKQSAKAPDGVILTVRKDSPKRAGSEAAAIWPAYKVGLSYAAALEAAAANVAAVRKAAAYRAKLGKEPSAEEVAEMVSKHLTADEAKECTARAKSDLRHAIANGFVTFGQPKAEARPNA